MGQASVLNEFEIRRVFRIIETTRHVERNRLCFVLSSLQWSACWGECGADHR